PCVTSPRRFPAPIPEIAVVVSLTIFASPQYCARCLLREGRCEAAGPPPAYSLRVLREGRRAAAGHPPAASILHRACSIADCLPLVYSLRVLAAGHPQVPAMGLIIPHPRYPRLPAQHEGMFH